MNTSRPVVCLAENVDDGFQQIDIRSEMPFCLQDSQKAVFQELEFYRFNSNIINFAKPNYIMLCLENANFSFQKAEQKYKAIYGNCKTKCVMDFDLLTENTNEIYDYLSLKINEVINSYCAIESFSNVSIPINYTYTQKNKTYDKLKIERFLSTKEKISNIFPDIYQIESISVKSSWQNYINIELIRNQIIHQKTDEHNKLTANLLINQNTNFARVAKEIIEYYIDNVFSKPLEELSKLDVSVFKYWPQFKNPLKMLTYPSKMEQFSIENIQNL